MTERRIALLGIFGTGNFGNEGSLSAMLSCLETEVSRSNLYCICTHPDKVAADYGITSLPLHKACDYKRARFFFVRLLHRLLIRFPYEIRHWWLAFRLFRKVDALIIPGTGIFDDYAVVPLDFPYALFKWSFCARLAGAKVAFVSVGAGPIRHSLSRWFMRAAARAATYRSYRDQKSKDFMVSIGVAAGRDPVFPDLVFSLPRPSARPARQTPQLTVGLGLMTYFGWTNDALKNKDALQHYIDKIIDFAIHILERGHSIRIIIGELSDRMAVDYFGRGLAIRCAERWKDRITAEPIGSLGDVLLEVAGCDLVVATRFHNVVCSLMLDRPAISVGYADKNATLLGEMGLGAYCQAIDDLDVTSLIQQFDSLCTDLEQHASAIREKRLIYQARLQEQMAQVLSSFR